MKKKSKRYKEITKHKLIDKKLSAKDILELVKKNANAKFEESIDVSLKINLKPIKLKRAKTNPKLDNIKH